MPKMLPMRSTATSRPACADPGNEGVASGLVGIGAGEPDQPAVAIPADLPEFPEAAEQALRVDRERCHASAPPVRGCDGVRPHSDQFRIALRIGRAFGVDDEDAGRFVEVERRPDLRIRRGANETGEACAAALARHDGRIVADGPGQAVHHRDRILLVDGHEGIGDARQHPPGDQRRLVAFEHRHDRRLAMRRS